LSGAGLAEGVTAPFPEARPTEAGCWNRTDLGKEVFLAVNDAVGGGTADPEDGAEDDEVDEGGDEDEEDGDEGAEEDAPMVPQPNAKLQAL